MSNPSTTQPPALTLRLLPGRLAVCKLPANAPVPDWAMETSGPLLSVTRTASELSLIVAEGLVPPEMENLHAEKGWRFFVVDGPLPFDVVGVIAGITAPLAQANVPVFVVSTFDTDYLLVKETDLARAIKTLRAARFVIEGD